MVMAKYRAQDDVLVPLAAFSAPAPARQDLKPLTLLYTLVRIAIGAVFVWSGTIKMLDHRHFAVIIEAYGLIPEAAVIPTALCLSLFELLAGFGLIWDVQGSLVMITGMLLLFMAILGYGLWLGLDVDCGCFGPQDPEAEAYHGLRPALYRDVVMLAGIGFLFLWRRMGSVRPRMLRDCHYLNFKGRRNK